MDMPLTSQEARVEMCSLLGGLIVVLIAKGVITEEEFKTAQTQMRAKLDQMTAKWRDDNPVLAMLLDIAG